MTVENVYRIQNAIGKACFKENMDEILSGLSEDAVAMLEGQPEMKVAIGFDNLEEAAKNLTNEMKFMGFGIFRHAGCRILAGSFPLSIFATRWPLHTGVKVA